MDAVTPAVAVASRRYAGKGSAPGLQSSCSRFCRFVCRLLDRVVSQPQWRVAGHYSISKLDAFDKFQRSATQTNIFGHLIASALPSLVINLALEAIPLASPSLGSSHAASFIVRFFLTMMITSMLSFINMSEYIVEFPVISWSDLLLHGLLMSIVGMAVCTVVIFSTDIFPFPLIQFVPGFPMAVAYRLLISSYRFTHLPGVQEREKYVNNLIGVEQSPLIAYPLFTALFMASSPTVQLWLSAALPALKFGVRTILFRAGWRDVDLLGILTNAGGHLFHILFVATCLQNAKSLKTMGVIVAFNSIQMLLNGYDIAISSRRVRHCWAEVCDLSSTHLKNSQLFTDGYISSALRLASEQSVGRSLHFDKPSIFLSTNKHYRHSEFLERHQAILLTTSESLDNHQMRQVSLPTRFSKRSQSVTVMLKKIRLKPTVWLIQRRSRLRKIAPAQTEHQPTITLTHSKQVKKKFILEICATLHQTEMIMLRSYITISMLSFYAVYLVVVFCLPNHKYFLTMRFMTTTDAVKETAFRLLTLCALECVFASIYLGLLWYRLGLSGLSQLAFVLSSQRVLFQAKCIALPIVILGFALEHYGNGIILNFGHTNP